MGDNIITIMALLPFVFFAAIFILVIVLLVKVLKWNPKSARSREYEQLATESIQFQKDTIQKQQYLSNELEEVKESLVSIERMLKEVE